MKWTGKGFLPGIPARDLTAAEVAQYGEKLLLASGLYVPDAVAGKRADKPADVKPAEGDK
jgi:hypothetical protein